MSEKLGKELTSLFNTTLKQVTEHKVEGHGFRVKVALASYGEIEFETTPPTIIAGGGNGQPRRQAKKVTMEMVEGVLQRFQEYPIKIEDTHTHIIVQPTDFLGPERYGKLKDAFIKMCGSHQPWNKEQDGKKSHWAFPKGGV